MAVYSFPDQDIIQIRKKDLSKLKSMALDSPLKRARYCLHHTTEDPVQEMIIALHNSTYVRPHRHIGKSESFHIIEGILNVVIFDNFGEVKKLLKWVLIFQVKHFVIDLRIQIGIWPYLQQNTLFSMKL